MISKNYWKKFLETGNIQYYIDYKKSMKKEVETGHIGEVVNGKNGRYYNKKQ